MIKILRKIKWDQDQIQKMKRNWKTSLLNLLTLKLLQREFNQVLRERVSPQFLILLGKMSVLWTM